MLMKNKLYNYFTFALAFDALHLCSMLLRVNSNKLAHGFCNKAVVDLLSNKKKLLRTLNSTKNISGERNQSIET